jgi:Dolichyl-phosphate-mannose-protein mannosyltransferase
MLRKNLLRALWWLGPIAFFVWLYFDGLKTWFVADDFAWLSLLQQVHSFHDLLNALFAPAAQGTIRPWSERGFFLLFESLFGLDSLPWRICVFVTVAADVALLAWLTRRITGSAIAGFLAPILWTANTAMVTVMTWTSAYNEALCSLFLLAAIALFQRYAETGRRAWWWWQLVVFTLGFGVLEINVVYPALAAAWVLFIAPPAKRKSLYVSLAPLFGISVAYYLMHRVLVPLPKDGPYALAFDARIFGTAALYWKWSLLPETWVSVGHSPLVGNLIFGLLTAGLAAFLFREIRKLRYSVIFFVFWFLITLAPMLPLPDHRTDYYLTIPLLGLAMLGAFGISEAWTAVGAWAGVWKLAAVAMPLVYLIGMYPVTRVAERWWLDRSLAVRGLVLGVAAAQEAHPGKTIVLDGVNTDLYNISMADSALTSVGLKEAYLTPNEGDMIHPGNDFGKLAHLVMDPGALRNAITHDQVVVYSDVGDHLRNITGVWERLNSNRLSPNQRLDKLPSRVEVGNPLLAYLLGPEWLPLESSGFRWMPRRAAVRLGGPRSAREKLLLEGYCPDQQLSAGVLHLLVTVDGISLPISQIGHPENSFRRLIDVPPSLVGRDSVEVVISVDRTFSDSAGRELGLVFGTIAFE